MKQLFFCVLFLTSLTSIGQRDAAHWYFGSLAGLDFNSGIPQALSDSQLDTTEGSSAISDKDTGALLFYTEGTNIWTRNHGIMANGTGLLGSLSSTQSAVIVPLPGSDTLFYVITSDVVQAYQAGGTGNGINYSVVDITGDGGLGEVIEKNTPILPQGSEKISVVETADGSNFWIVTHFENQFYSFLLDSTGLNTTPIISTIGPIISDPENFRGAMKITPDGTQLAIAHCLSSPSLGGLAYLYDFNNATGTVTNQTLIDDELVYYGVEFSSDSSKLYFSGKTIDNQGESDRLVIEQYDLNAPSVPNSKFIVSDQENEFLSDLGGALQIAMDRKIYHSQPGNSLSVINNPKLPGPQVEFSEATVGLGIRNSSFGLPQYIQSFFESFISIENTCENDQTEFIVDPLQNVIAASWNFGDDFSGPNNTSTLINPTHVFSNPGLYTVTVEFQFSDRVPKTFVEFVEITPQLDLPPSLVFDQCDIDGNDNGLTIFNLVNLTNLALEQDGLDYRFFETLANAQQEENVIPNPLNYENTSNGETLYLVVGENLVCNDIVEITLNVFSGNSNSDFTHSVCDVLLSQTDVWFALGLLADEILLGFSEEATVEFYLTFNDLVGQTNELFLDNVPHSFTELNFENVFYRVSLGASCLGTGEVTFDILQGVEEGNKTIGFCVTDGGITLVTDDVYFSYDWSTGETTPTIFVDEPGIYTVDVVSLAGCDGRIQFIVESLNVTEVSIAVDDFQQNNSIVVTPSDPTIELFYSIDGGLTFQDNGVFNDLVPRTYALVVRDLSECNAINEIVVVRGAPRFFTPNGDGVHDRWHVNNASTFPGMTVQVMDRFGKGLASLTSTSPGWDGTYGGVELPTNAYWYRIDYLGESFVGHFTLIRR